MAINKSFVIKNGVQVSTDLIIGDADNNKVGIGTTIPFYNLHVGRGRGSRGGIGVTDAVVSGVATISQLSVTGISTFAGALDVNSTVDFAGDVVFNGTHDITYDQSESALVFNDNAAIRVGTGSDFSIMHDGSNTILRERGTGGLKILGSQIELLGSTAGETLAKFTEDGGIELYDDNTKRIETTGLGATVFGDLTISGVTTSARLLVTGISTFTGLVDANGGAHIDNLRLGIDADNDITTSSGNLTLDSTGGTVEVNDNLQVDGQTDLNGDINLGNATSDTITATGRFDSNLVPNGDTEDLGTSSQEWNDLFLDGTAHIDVLDVDETAFVTTKLTVGTGVTIQNNGAVSIAGVTTANSGVRVNADSGNSDPDSATNYFSVGASEDLKIYHNGGTNYIASRDGDIQIRSDTFMLVSDDTAGRAIYLDNSNSRLELGFDGNHDAHYTGSGIDFLNDVDIDDTTQSTSNTTGALKVDGGVGIAKNVNIGGNLDVDGTSNFNDDVTLVAAGSSTILFDASAHKLVFQDNIRANFGTGEDLSIYHDSLNSYIDDAGTGNLNIRTTETHFQRADGAQTRAIFKDTAVELYHDNSKKVETTSGGLNITGITTMSGRLQVTSGISTFSDTTQSTSATTGAVVINGGVGIAKNVNIGGNLTVTGTTTFNGGTLTLGDANTDNIVFGGEVDSNIIPDDDNTHDLGSSSQQWKDIYINGVGYIDSISADTAAISDLTDNRVVIAGASGELEDDANFTFDGSKLNVGSGVATVTTTGNAAFVGVVTAGRGFNLGIASAGLTVARNVGISTLNFIGTGNSITYHATHNQLDISIGGSGGGGGVSETSTSVSSTSATSCGSFEKASKRSAAVLAQITQGSAYQIGRYLLIHDGTTVTTIEESAIATGSMLGTFEGVINGDDVEFRVTMSSSSSATVITKIDSISI